MGKHRKVMCGIKYLSTRQFSHLDDHFHTQNFVLLHVIVKDRLQCVNHYIVKLGCFFVIIQCY